MKAVLALSMVLSAFNCLAANFIVSPVRIDLNPRQTSQAIQIKNVSDTEPIIIQAQAVLWSQDESGDKYDKTSEVLVTPPLVTIPPNQTQILRVLMRPAANRQDESTYRLIVKEIPPQRAEGLSGIQIALEMNLPIFFTPPGIEPKPLNFALGKADQKFSLKLENPGGVHVQVSSLKLFADNGAEIANTGSNFYYVLPRQARAVVLTGVQEDILRKSGSIRIKANSDAGPIDQKVDFKP